MGEAPRERIQVSFFIPDGGLHLQFCECNPQHGRAFRTVGFLEDAFEGGRRGLLCSRFFLYSLCFILLYRLCTCFGFILRNLILLCSVEFFAAWLSCFLFLGCSVAGGIWFTTRGGSTLSGAIHTVHTYIHTYMHACKHACIHTYIHTYTLDT